MRRTDDGRFLSAEIAPEGVVRRFVRPSVALDDLNTRRMVALLTHFIEGGEAGHLIVELRNIEYWFSRDLTDR